jgi:hypothetical protein
VIRPVLRSGFRFRKNFNKIPIGIPENWQDFEGFEKPERLQSSDGFDRDLGDHFKEEIDNFNFSSRISRYSFNGCSSL